MKRQGDTLRRLFVFACMGLIGTNGLDAATNQFVNLAAAGSSQLADGTTNTPVIVDILLTGTDR